MKFPGKRASASGNTPSSNRADEAQSEETLRARARRRLIGAVVLVMTGVVVFPLIFETQPKPVASSMNLVIPPQSQASAVLPIRPASGAFPASAAKPAATGAQTGAATATAAVAIGATAAVQSAKPQASPLPKPAASVASGAHKPTQIAAPAAKPHHADAARVALAALSGKQPGQISNAELAAATKSQQRFVVQAGAFAEQRAAQQLVRKIDAAGLKAYTQKITTHQGQRWRVRVGPFPRRAQADKAASHLKALGVSGAVIGL